MRAVAAFWGFEPHPNPPLIKGGHLIVLPLRQCKTGATKFFHVICPLQEFSTEARLPPLMSHVLLFKRGLGGLGWGLRQLSQARSA